MRKRQGVFRREGREVRMGVRYSRDAMAVDRNDGTLRGAFLIATVGFTA